jgi:hypothetical protein
MGISSNFDSFPLISVFKQIIISNYSWLPICRLDDNSSNNIEHVNLLKTSQDGLVFLPYSGLCLLQSDVFHSEKLWLLALREEF